MFSAWWPAAPDRLLTHTTVAVAVSAALLLPACGNNPAQPGNPVPPGSAVLAGAGDIGDCGAGGESTARLLDTIQGAVFTAGDLAYPHGSERDFRDCYQGLYGLAELVDSNVAEACANTLEQDAWMATEVERLATLVMPAVLADTRKQFADDAFAADLDFLRSFAANRGAFVRAEIATLR